ncbi:MAG: hypothetical protein CVV27_18890 [Candidatus Melainabacteria bacterium HGW-Melainabacteria-1]|nr:MAG: hypothetical protein CVV27_18890 [Candidatus Melainabacteria bacterium HGW-Melainabacteria-1]
MDCATIRHMASQLPLNPALLRPYLLEGLFSPDECAGLIIAGRQGRVLADPYTSQHPKRSAAGTGERRALLDQVAAGLVVQRLMQAAYQVNQAHFCFEIQSVEVPHFITYSPGQASPWHMDITDDQTTNRKLTMLIFLSDPGSYSGGRFAVFPGELEIDQSQGNVLLFPAF